MSGPEDLLPDADDPETPSADAPDGQQDGLVETPDEPKRKPALRLAALVITPILLLVVVLVVWLFGDGFLTGQVRKAIVAADLDPTDTVIEASLIGGRVALTDAELVDEHEDQRRTIYRSPSTVLDLAVLDSALHGAPIIQELTVRDARLDLRRFPDGSVPGLGAEEDVDGPDDPEEAPGADEPRDLVELYQRWKDRYQRAKEWAPERDEDSGEIEQPRKPARGWERAVRYFPKPDETAGNPFPRTLIRNLTLEGSGLVLPDSEQDRPSPLDLAGFTLSGETVTNRLEAGETMTLGGTYSTTDAGSGKLDYRATTEEGELDWAWSGIPLASIGDPAVSGDRIHPYGPRGSAELALAARWQGTALEGSIVIDLIDLKLKPTADAPPEAAEIAKGLKELRKLHAKLAEDEPFVIRWKLTLGGTTSDPEIVDLGAESFQQALKRTAKQLKQAALDKANEAVDQAKEQAVEEGKGLIDDVKKGDDPEEAAKDRLDKLKDEKEGLKDLNPFGD